MLSQSLARTLCLLLLVLTLTPNAAASPLIRPYSKLQTQTKSQEDTYREMVYAQTDLRIKQNNQKYGEYFISDHNHFSIYTQEQFKQLFLGGGISKPDSEMRRNVQSASLQQKNNLQRDIQSKAALLNSVVPKVFNVDYTSNKNPRLVSPVRNQGSCGSCWAFAGIAELESYLLFRHGLYVDLSEQQMVDCVPKVQGGNHGCGGGLVDSVAFYANLYPVVQEKYYKYTGEQGDCDQKKIKLGKGFTIKSYAYTVDCLSLVNALISQKPIAICGGIDVKIWHSYKSGVVTQINFVGSGGHCVLLVGAASDGTTNKLNNWYKIKNSWGPGWGQGGYMRIYRDASDITWGPYRFCQWGSLYTTSS